MSHRVLAAVIGLILTAHSLSAQVIVLPGRGPAGGQGFGGFASAPISATTVLHSYMEAADSGAVLGFAVAIRGEPQWYNVHVTFHTSPVDSMPAGAVGQDWTVGAWAYRFIYRATQKTLTVFDTTIALDSSRVVLISLPARVGQRPSFRLGAPVAVSMREPTAFPPLFLPKSTDVRTFAGLP